MEHNRDTNSTKPRKNNNELLLHKIERRNDLSIDEIDNGNQEDGNTSQTDGCWGSLGETIIQCGKGKNTNDIILT